MKNIIRKIIVSSCNNCPFWYWNDDEKIMICGLDKTRQKIGKNFSTALKKLYSKCILPKDNKPKEG